MANYVLRRIFLIIPTLFAIMVLNFVIVQFAPGGPVEQMIAKLQGLDSDIQCIIGMLQRSDFLLLQDRETLTRDELKARISILERLADRIHLESYDVQH